jgi:hypothetical protein
LPFHLISSIHIISQRISDQAAFVVAKLAFPGLREQGLLFGRGVVLEEGLGHCLQGLLDVVPGPGRHLEIIAILLVDEARDGLLSDSGDVLDVTLVAQQDNHEFRVVHIIFYLPQP